MFQSIKVLLLELKFLLLKSIYTKLELESDFQLQNTYIISDLTVFMFFIAVIWFEINSDPVKIFQMDFTHLSNYFGLVPVIFQDSFSKARLHIWMRFKCRKLQKLWAKKLLTRGSTKTIIPAMIDILNH